MYMSIEFSELKMCLSKTQRQNAMKKRWGKKWGEIFSNFVVEVVLISDQITYPRIRWVKF